jgi:hypothetical protein|nr:MAG TPA: hypothetical protein [Caudoviricetes sp.]
MVSVVAATYCGYFYFQTTMPLLFLDNQIPIQAHEGMQYILQ